MQSRSSDYTLTLQILGFFAFTLSVGLWFAAFVRPGELSPDGFMYGLVVGALGAGGVLLMIQSKAEPTKPM